MTNPFAQALKTYDLLPDDLKPRFWDAMLYDWWDLESNGNPIEHVAAPTPYDAITYVTEADDEDESELGRQFLLDMIPVWDRVCEFLPPEDTTMFAGEKVSSGQYLAVRDCEWPERADDDYWVKLVFDNNDDPMQNPTVTVFNVHVVNHTITDIEVSR